MSECAVIPPLRLKSICVRTHRAKSGYLPAEYIPPTFWLVPPPPFAQVDGGGCYREKFFLFFQNIASTRQVFTRYSLSTLSFLVLYLSDFDLEFTSSRLRFSTLIIILDFMFFDSIFRLVFTRWILLASISTYLSIVDSML